MTEVELENCTIVVRSNEEYGTVAELRATWRRVARQIEHLFHSACHLIVIPQTTYSSPIPLDQMANMLEAALKVLVHLEAIAVVVDSTLDINTQTYQIGYVRGAGTNIRMFNSVDCAREWLSSQPHAHNCQYAPK